MDNTSSLDKSYALTSPLGSEEIEGFELGSSLRVTEGCVVGQSDTEG